MINTENREKAFEKEMLRFKSYLNRNNMDHKQYQYDGLKWILNNELRENPLMGVHGGFIADEMGMGKTIMMIGTFLCNFVSKTLIIVPPVLIDQWYVQIYRTTGHKALIYHGENKKALTIADLNKAIIVITTYGAVTMTKKQLKADELSILHQIKWDRLVFDEAHHLRNSKTIAYISAKKLLTRIRWLVSGTPIQNSKKDFYSLCRLIGLPSSFYMKSEKLRSLAQAFILKRTKKQVGIKMPNIIQDNNLVKWNNLKEMELSEEIHAALDFSRVGIKKSVKPIISSLMMNSISPLHLILRARQSCIYPKMMIKKLDSLIKEGCLRDYSSYKEALNSSSKLDYVVNKILERKGNGSGKLIFCHFREEIDEIASRLRVGGINRVATFDGRTSNSKRYDYLNDKNEALVLQIQTGCEGLNLQENYSEIYFISPHWNPAVEDQAIARCHRIGQTKDVYVERFEMTSFPEDEEQTVVTRTVDNYVCSVQGCKRISASEIIE